MAGKGKFPPLEEMTSAAYGVGRDSVAEAFAEGAPLDFIHELFGWPKCPQDKVKDGTPV